MKQLLVICFSICCFHSFAQAQLPQDETGHISYIDVVSADSLEQKLLYTNAKNWLKANAFNITSSPEDSLAGKLTATHGLYVYAKGYITKKIHGEITYTTTLEVKNGRYRYTFSDFVFHYYAEDRTFKYSPTGRTKPLEEQKASGWQALWEAHKRKTDEQVSGQIKTLKTAMVELPKVKNEPVVSKKSTSADW